MNIEGFFLINLTLYIYIRIYIYIHTHAPTLYIYIHMCVYVCVFSYHTRSVIFPPPRNADWVFRCDLWYYWLSLSIKV